MHTLHPNHRRLDDDDQIAMARLYAGVDNLSNRRKGASRHHFSIVRRDDDHLTGHRTIRVSPNHDRLWSFFQSLPVDQQLGCDFREV